MNQKIVVLLVSSVLLSSCKDSPQKMDVPPMPQPTLAPHKALIPDPRWEEELSAAKSTYSTLYNSLRELLAKAEQLIADLQQVEHEVRCKERQCDAERGGYEYFELSRPDREKMPVSSFAAKSLQILERELLDTATYPKLAHVVGSPTVVNQLEHAEAQVVSLKRDVERIQLLVDELSAKLEAARSELSKLPEPSSCRPCTTKTVFIAMTGETIVYEECRYLRYPPTLPGGGIPFAPRIEVVSREISRSQTAPPERFPLPGMFGR